MHKFKNILLLIILGTLVSCGGGGGSVSVLPSLTDFQQASNADVKIDILFVVDDSGSMLPGQKQLADNFSDFVEKFYDKGYDVRLAVAKTSAYGNTTNGETGLTVKAFRCGYGNDCGAGTQTWGICSSSYPTETTIGNGTPGDGIDHILSSSLPKATLVEKFAQNVKVGTCGHGTERGIQSAKEVLDAMSGVFTESFPRPGSHLAVIHVGDEQDAGSLNVSGYGSVNKYLQHLESLGADSVSVHAIEVTGTSTCKKNVGYYGGEPLDPEIYGTNGKIHSAGSKGAIQFALAELAGGLSLSICDPFAESLVSMGDSIASLASSFKLPDPALDSTAQGNLVVKVNSVEVPKNPTDGYQYDASENKIIFYGNSIPAQGAHIEVIFTCGTLTNCSGSGTSGGEE